ncbi:hypothetical protein K2173_016255 [Erythroxylum novogranatense]|uniref:ENTH domain-containing protein n=1 Tax=Erythroxylum novogranatense TaxID=1862640 RepID=A0AAV8SG02_9ROSI|nr:hypothetical protein K2173_016255 [Erythroxylum novogranatense]
MVGIYVMIMQTQTMAAGVNAPQTLRKAIDALKDSTKVGLAKVNSEYKGLDIAIVKATKHNEAVPKEKHIRKIFRALSASSPRMDVAYCIRRLIKRLKKTHKWTVALKALVIIHRALREIDSTFHGELLNFGRGRALVLNLYHFTDDSSTNARDCSAWIRSYACYLQEGLECIRILKYDVEKDYLAIRKLETPDLLRQLEALRELLICILVCKVCIQSSLPILPFALSLSISIPKVINKGDKIMVTSSRCILGRSPNIRYFNSLSRNDRIEAQAWRLIRARRLDQFFDLCRSLSFGRGQNFVNIEQPPESFLSAMEDYPKILMVPIFTYFQSLQLPTQEAVPTQETSSLIDDDKEDEIEWKSNPVLSYLGKPLSFCQTWEDFTQEAPEKNENDHLGLAIVTDGSTLHSANFINTTPQSASWELELVTAPTSRGAALVETKLVGGLDKMSLDHLYNDAFSGKTSNGTQLAGQVPSNPFENDFYSSDRFYENEFYNYEPFYVISTVSPSKDTQIVPVVQKQAFLTMENEWGQKQADATNPFGNSYLDPSMSSKTVPPQSSCTIFI